MCCLSTEKTHRPVRSNFPESATCFTKAVEVQSELIEPNRRAINVVEKLNEVLALVEQPVDSISLTSPEAIIWKSEAADELAADANLLTSIRTPLIALISTYVDANPENWFIPLDFIEQHSIVDAESDAPLYTTLVMLTHHTAPTAETVQSWSMYQGLQDVSRSPVYFLDANLVQFIRNGEVSIVDSFTRISTHVMFISNAAPARIEWLMWRFHADEITQQNLLARFNLQSKQRPPVIHHVSHNEL